MNLGIMFGYCLGVKRVLPWNEIVEMIWDTTGGWWDFNERLFDLGIENCKVFSSCWFVLFNSKYRWRSYLFVCLSFLLPFFLSLLLFCLDVKAWLFCVALLLRQCPSKSMNDTRRKKKLEQKENRLCSSIFSNSTAIDNQSLISLISFTFLLVLTPLHSPPFPLKRFHVAG